MGVFRSTWKSRVGVTGFEFLVKIFVGKKGSFNPDGIDRKRQFLETNGNVTN